MSEIEIEGGPRFPWAEGDTLLAAGLRAGLGMPYECNAGGCGTCKIEVTEGEVETLWPEAPGLSDRDRRKGRVLACQSRPRGDCRVRLRLDPACVPPVPPRRQRARLIGAADITHDIRKFRFATETPADFLPGQYAMLTVDGGPRRAYSLANIANGAGEWHFQIRRVPGGAMTGLLFDDPPRTVDIDGPYGLAHLRPGARDLVCVAGGSGLAPMVSIARGIAADPNDGRCVHFIHAGRSAADLPGAGWAKALTGLGNRLDYRPVVSGDECAGLPRGFAHEALDAFAAGRFDDFDYYCAGPPPMMQALENLLLVEQGLPASRLRFDRFF